MNGTRRNHHKRTSTCRPARSRSFEARPINVPVSGLCSFAYKRSAREFHLNGIQLVTKAEDEKAGENLPAQKCQSRGARAKCLDEPHRRDISFKFTRRRLDSNVRKATRVAPTRIRRKTPRTRRPRPTRRVNEKRFFRRLGAADALGHVVRQ